MTEQNEIVLYQPNEQTKLEVRVMDESVWLNQNQIVELFDSSKANISEHIKNIYAQHELEEEATVRDFRTVQQEGKRQEGVSATIYTQTIGKQLQLDINKHNAQYRPIRVEKCKNVHDRFLLIDDTVYHIGASIKDLGKKLFAFSKMEMPAKDILKQLN